MNLLELSGILWIILLPATFVLSTILDSTNRSKLPTSEYVINFTGRLMFSFVFSALFSICTIVTIALVYRLYFEISVVSLTIYLI